MSQPTGLAVGDVHVVQLRSKNANAIDSKLLDTLENELQTAANNSKKAVVITGYSNYFCSGLNLKNLPSNRKGMSKFIDRFEALNLQLLQSPMPIVSAISGHAIAGGCVLACATDFRIGSTGHYKVGVSEVSLGIMFPASAFEIMRNTLSPLASTEVLLAGKLLTPTEAAKAGILHTVVSKAHLLEEALKIAHELGNKPTNAFHHSKLALNKLMLKRIKETRVKARQGFLDSWFSPEVTAKRKGVVT